MLLGSEILLSRPELKELQLKRLRETLERIISSVPFYTEALAATARRDLKSSEQITDLPFTTKSDLRNNYPLGFLAVKQNEVLRIHASSGTRGKPTIAAYTDGDLRIWAELCARSLETAGVRPGDVLQNCYGYGLFTGGLGLHQGAEALGATVIPSSSGRSQHQLMLMQDFQTRVLCCTPSYALTLALFIEEKKVDRAKLKLEIGIFGAEPWSQECREQIEQRLRIKAFDIYGLSEIMGPGVAIECREQNGLHIWEDHFFVEVIDPKTELPLPDGTPGELVITTLTKRAMPLLRYRTGDSCALMSDPCKCGSPFRRITRLSGRFDDMLIIRGINVYPSEIESIIYSLPALGSEYQIVIDRVQTLDSLTVRAEIRSEFEEQWQKTHSDATERRLLQEELEDLLQQRLGLSANVEIVQQNLIPRSEGKAVRVLDMRAL